MPIDKKKKAVLAAVAYYLKEQGIECKKPNQWVTIRRSIFNVNKRNVFLKGKDRA